MPVVEVEGMESASSHARMPERVEDDVGKGCVFEAAEILDYRVGSLGVDELLSDFLGLGDSRHDYLITDTFLDSIG